jgi:tRNA U34 5-carboxymethylaminomethyl modifying GTPase MnmE/TrmE
VVGTHIDMIKKSDDLLKIQEEIQNMKISQLKHLCFVSCKSGKGIKELEETLVNIVKTKNLNKRVIPSFWVKKKKIIFGFFFFLTKINIF